MALDPAKLARQVFRAGTKRYLIVCHLNGPLEDYPALERELAKLQAKPLLVWNWVVRRRNSSAQEVYDRIRRCVDAHVGLFVVSLEDDADWIGPRLLHDFDDM